MKFIDSNIIAYAFYQNQNQDNCQSILQQEEIMTDAIALVEAFNVIELQTSREMAVMAIRSILRSQLKIVDIDTNIIFEMLKKTERYKSLTCIDLIHFTVASLATCEAVISYDKDFNGLEIPRREE